MHVQGPAALRTGVHADPLFTVQPPFSWNQRPLFLSPFPSWRYVTFPM
jgi:hypothetical protein